MTIRGTLDHGRQLPATSSAEPSEPFGLSSGSKTIAKTILMRIRYSICESKHLVMGNC